MGSPLRNKIHQGRPIKSLKKEATRNLHRPIPFLNHVSKIRGRLVGQTLGVTGPLDKVEEADLVRRERSATNRRCVPTLLTPKARVLFNRRDGPAADLQPRQSGYLPPGQRRPLVETPTRIHAHLHHS
ncbi:hypothetical protein LAJ19_16550 (plasmid) [Deinococcus taeanensis]|uniref:hypothetical protein n=1 Tax=Deinococcus taeanensis TaxID=2737050 RepID=UPI001CDBAD49|nr:hypothetical protein [Deinococcus taeanensis]UBV44761.1 hypothetical protein LAJ19_16550 [Deinococcus taeanensis]